MQDPGSGVPPPLLQHVHLLSDFRFAYTPMQLSPEGALDLLMKGPQIFKDHPVSWQFFSTPSDGTLRLAWQPTNQLGNHYATDGIIWASPETGFAQDVRGYKIECYVCECGFVPQAEQVAAHRRMRYRLISSPNNAQVDPSIEIVHYTASLPSHRIPVRQIQTPQQALKSVNERRFLEASGVLKSKAFMLQDRTNWPHMTLPSSQNLNNPQGRGAGSINGPSTNDRGPVASRGGRGQSQGNMGQMPQMGHTRGPSMQWQGPGGPPGAVPFVDDFLKDEDNHAYGDALDFVTPRDLSTLRYKQHHLWMEEVLSTPYELKRIRPVNLALRAEGDLKWLTDGLWDIPQSDENLDKEVVSNTVASKPRSITAKNVQEFERRVDKFLRKEEKKVSDIKDQHIEVMDQMSQQKLFANLERRLAEASSDAEMNEIVKEAEAATAAIVGRRQQILTVSKGGMLNAGEEKLTSNNDEFEDDFTTNMDTAGEALDFYDDQMEFTSADVTV